MLLFEMFREDQMLLLEGVLQLEKLREKFKKYLSLLQERVCSGISKLGRKWLAPSKQPIHFRRVVHQLRTSTTRHLAPTTTIHFGPIQKKFYIISEL